MRLLPQINPAGTVPALILLREAFDDAQDYGRDIWQFAVEMEHLLAAGATVGVLRRWAEAGLVSHGVETTDRNSQRRTFAQVKHLRFEPGTCFVLAANGLVVDSHDVLKYNSGGQDRNGTTPRIPRWDRRRLWWGAVVVKEFRQPAPNQKLVLDTFQEVGWPAEIDDPLPGQAGRESKLRLHETIQSLNRNRRVRLLRFGGTGTGEGVRWEAARENITRGTPKRP